MMLLHESRMIIDHLHVCLSDRFESVKKIGRSKSTGQLAIVLKSDTYPRELKIGDHLTEKFNSISFGDGYKADFPR
jgi:hypothetical protein